jgi:putative transposase
VIVVWDNIAIHGGPEIEQLCERHRRLHLVRLPAYAPELNPDEGVWKLTKEALANGRPDSIYDLWPELVGALERVRRSRLQLRGCIHGSELPFATP